jgi:hypothetical protein
VKSEEKDRTAAAVRNGAAALAAAFLLLAGLACSTADEQAVQQGLNPAPPIRKAFSVSLEITAQQIGQYALENGQVPQGEGVEVLHRAGIRNAPSMDPWSGEVRYVGEGSHFTLSSAGPDTQWETEDDLVIQR